MENSIKVGKFQISFDTLITVNIGLISLCYIILISKIAPFQQDRYYMCIYPFLMLCFVYTLHKLLGITYRNDIAGKVISFLLILVIVIGGLVKQNPSYLYHTSSIREAELKKYSDYPIVVLNGAYSWYATRWITEYSNFSEVYLCKYENDFSILEKIAKSNDVTDGFLLYVLRFPEDDEEIFRDIRKHLLINDYKKLCDGEDRVFFCTMEE